MSKLIQFSLSSTVILSTEKAAQVLALLEEAWELRNEWSDKDISITKNQAYTFSAFSEEKFRNITKAQVAGMSYKEYIDAQQESRTRLQTNKDLPE